MSNEMTDRRVEDLYAWAIAWDAEPVGEHAQRLQEDARYEFREWLAGHDREVAEAAWDEGCAAARLHAEQERSGSETRIVLTNPYRKEYGR